MDNLSSFKYLNKTFMRKLQKHVWLIHYNNVFFRILKIVVIVNQFFFSLQRKFRVGLNFLMAQTFEVA